MTATIILDCDPGIDDALAIAFAHGNPDIDLLGITTVAGNVGLDRTTQNALAVCEFIGAAGTPVTAGCATPLVRPALDARHVHGESGLGGAELPPPTTRPATGHAADYIIDTVAAAPGEITLVATGPLTNIALAVLKEPRLPELVRDFVIMGGSSGRGNTTPAAEYNIWADPEAAAAVFRAGWTVTMLGLDVTMRTGAGPAVRERMGTLGPLGSDLLLPALDQYRSLAGAGGPPVHDVCAVAYVAEPAVFGLVPARVEVETSGRLTSGMTVTDFRTAEPNSLIAMNIDTTRFWDLTLAAYGRVADNQRMTPLLPLSDGNKRTWPAGIQLLIAPDGLLGHFHEVGVAPAFPVATGAGQRYRAGPAPQPQPPAHRQHRNLAAGGIRTDQRGSAEAPLVEHLLQLPGGCHGTDLLIPSRRADVG
jgi:purine nucleosidase